MKKNIRARRKEVTYTPEEWERVVVRASSVSLKPATYIKRMSLNGAININNYKEITTLMNALRIIGNNINQLAKKANEINSIYAADYEKMKEDYSGICRTLNQYLSTLQ